MSFAEFKTVADKVRCLTDYLYFHVMGEPLCHPELPAFISYANSLGYKCAVTTNGTLLKERGEELIKAGVYKVNISLHSLEDEDGEDYVESCLNFADRASLSGVLAVLRLWNGENDGGVNAPLIKKIKEHFKDCEWVFGARGARIRHKLHLEYGERFEWPDMNAHDMGDEMFCYGLSDHFGILCDGTVIPCCLDSEGSIALGNIFSQNINEILASPRAESIRVGFKKHHTDEELCRRCAYARRFKV